MELNKWEEYLSWCPSECYYYFINENTGKKYCIYLRWRREDPWTASLTECKEDWSMNYSEWIDLDLGRSYAMDEYKSLEKNALKEVKKLLGIRKENKILKKLKNLLCKKI